MNKHILLIFLVAVTAGVSCAHQKDSERASDKYESTESKVRKVMERNQNLTTEQREALDKHAKENDDKENQYIGYSEEQLLSVFGPPKQQWMMTTWQVKSSLGFNPPGKVKYRGKVKRLLFLHAGREYHLWLVRDKNDKWTVVADFNWVEGSQF